MKTFTKSAAQGDLLILKISALPNGVMRKDPTNGRHIVAHSETGHHHLIEADDGVEYYTDPKDALQAYLVVQKAIGAALIHARSFDTHDPILIPPGIYSLRRQREHTPMGWRKVED